MDSLTVRVSYKLRQGMNLHIAMSASLGSCPCITKSVAGVCRGVLCQVRNLEELVVKPVLVADSVVLLQTLDQSGVILEDEVLEHAALLGVENTLFGHLGDNSEEHAGLRPDMRRQDALGVATIALLEQVPSCSDQEQIVQVLIAEIVQQLVRLSLVSNRLRCTFCQGLRCGRQRLVRSDSSKAVPVGALSSAYALLMKSHVTLSRQLRLGLLLQRWYNQRRWHRGWLRWWTHLLSHSLIVEHLLFD